MKRALLLIAALAAVLAATLFICLRRSTPAIAAVPEAKLPTLPETAANSVKLSYVELAASPHRSEQTGATQVYGWVTRGDDGKPVGDGSITLMFEDFATAPLSAVEEHARPDRVFDIRLRNVSIQEDGGWFIDLPGKCWIVEVIFTPRAAPVFYEFAEFWGNPAQTPMAATAAEPLPFANNAPVLNDADMAALQFDPHGVTLTEGGLSFLSGDLARIPPNLGGAEPRPPARKRLIKTRIPIEVPLERGALEITFAAGPGIQARGLVFDAQSGEPIAGAQVFLTSMSSGGIVAGTGPDGGFELYGIDPEDVRPENGLVTFVVLAPGHALGMRQVAWERGQTCIPAFKVVLEPDPR